MMISRILSRSLATSASQGNSLPTHMKEFLEARAKLDTFDKILSSKLKIISAPENKGYCLGELKVEASYLNVGKVMHGGALTTLFDAITTYALFNTAIRQPGVSVDIKLSFIKPVKENETILVEGKLRKAGAKIAFLDGNIYLKENDSYELKDKHLIASGQHIKFISQKK